VLLRALVVLLAVATGACAAKSGVPRPFPGAPAPADPPTATAPVGPPAATAPAETADAAGTFGTLVRTALEFLGVPYRNGGSDPSGFDCSGFVQWVFGRHGLALPREVRDQYEAGRRVDLDEVREGDLLFFQTVARGASHVGIALDNGRFVHAPSSRGVVRVEPYTASYWARRFVGARRIREKVEEVEEVEEVEKVEKVEEVEAPVRPRVFPGQTSSTR
jgi:cell wall-associated NlpC family hydrolase